MGESEDRMRRRLAEVSPTFCLAKWLQVTIHLQTGQTHSCHHPPPHTVPLSEVRADPGALHNSGRKKEARRQMLAGERPPECDYCWRIEDTPGGHVSDRILKSNEFWAEPHFDRIRSQPWDQGVSPAYLEISFSNLCNFVCAYCQPKDSSRWMEEVERHGHYPTSNRLHNLDEIREAGAMPIHEGKPNAYVEAFWKWWPAAYEHLKVLRITGGEPLLHKGTFQVLDYILERPRPDLEFSINSNLGVPERQITGMIERLARITREKRIRELTLYTSVDTWGPQAEYIRHGMSLREFQANVERVLAEIPGVNLTFMCTYNALSVPSFEKLLDVVLGLRRRHSAAEGSARIILDIPYLRNPSHLSVKVLTPDFAERVAAQVRAMEERSAERLGPRLGFHEFEIVRLRRMHAWMLRPETDAWIVRNRHDFRRFFQEHDRRRGTDFAAAFPEFADFWETCKKAKESFEEELFRQIAEDSATRRGK